MRLCWLWIALKSWYLWYSNNQKLTDIQVEAVVNCSQKLISLIFGTTGILTELLNASCELLSKSWYLWYSEQLCSAGIGSNYCCELLSKLISLIFGTTTVYMLLVVLVVNCSQKLISLIFGTTPCGRCIECMRLWIALKSWYLWYSEQPATAVAPPWCVVNCSQSWYLWYSEQLWGAER